MHEHRVEYYNHFSKFAQPQLSSAPPAYARSAGSASAAAAALFFSRQNMRQTCAGALAHKYVRSMNFA